MLGIVHLTDLHFGKGSEEVFADKHRLLASLVAAVEGPLADASQRLLVVSGDLVYQGRTGAYAEAERFIDDLRHRLSIHDTDLVICPGNHDIIRGQADPFHPLNQLIYRLTHRSERTFTHAQRNFLIAVGEVDVLVFNSAFRGDDGYGFVDLSPGAFPDVRETSRLRVAVLHHNLLGVYEDDASTLRNAYPFLAYLAHQGVDLVLHGHQHSLQDLPSTATSCRIVGCGSLNFRNPGGNPNQFNLVLASPEGIRVLRHLWDPDLIGGGARGGWRVS